MRSNSGKNVMAWNPSYVAKDGESVQGHPAPKNRRTLRRLEALEQKALQDTGKWHTLLVASDEEEEQQTAALKASPKWTKGDNLMVIRLVAAEPAEVRKQSTSIEASAAGLLS